jgi:hypothetical protein
VSGGESTWGTEWSRVVAPKKETQAGNVIHHGSYRQLSLMQKVSLPLPSVVRAESVRRLPEVSREALDSADTTAYSL